MVKLTVHYTGNGVCSLTGKEGEGIACTTDDGTVVNQFLSWKAYRQLLSMKCAQHLAGENKPPGAAADSKPVGAKPPMPPVVAAPARTPDAGLPQLNSSRA